MKLTLILQEDRLGIFRLAADAPVPREVLNEAGFYSITRTPEELSIVCAESLLPENETGEKDWRVFRVAGKLDFSLTGVLAAIAGPLAKSGISMFALSTFDTDYILVKADDIEKTSRALEAAGHIIRA